MDLDKDVVVGALAALGGCLAITVIAFIGVAVWLTKRTMWQAQRIKALEENSQSQPHEKEKEKEKAQQKPVGTQYGIISGIAAESDFASTRYENSDVLLGGATE